MNTLAPTKPHRVAKKARYILENCGQQLYIASLISEGHKRLIHVAPAEVVVETGRDGGTARETVTMYSSTDSC